MSGLNAAEERYSKVVLFGRPCLFTDSRIDPATVPAGLHRYELRHSDYGDFEPVQAAKGIWVNFYGTVLSDKELVSPRDNYRDIDDGEFLWNGEMQTIEEYRKENAPTKPAKTKHKGDRER